MFLGLLLIGLVTRVRELVHGGNAARKALRPLVAGLDALHPTPLAHNGDSGYGLDNSHPWHHVYLIVDGTPDPEDTIRTVAAAAGFHLEEYHKPYLEPFEQEPPPLVAEHDGRTLTVGITRTGRVTVLGTGKAVRGYGTRFTPPAGKVVVSLSLSLPPV